jgi:protein O-mannosyl-transferase
MVRTRTTVAAVMIALWIFVHPLRAQTTPELPAIVVDQFEPEIREQVRKAYDDARAAPRDALSNGWLGMTLHTYEQYEFAAICYARAHRLASKEFRWAYYLGVSLAALGKQSEAAEAFKDAIRIDANHLPATLRLADALLAAGEPAESKQLYEAIAKRNPAIAQAYYGLGRIAAAGGDQETAVAHFRKALNLFADYGTAHYALGIALRDQGKKIEAQEHLSQSQRLGLSRPTLEDPEIVAIAEMNAGGAKHLRRGALLGKEGKLAESIVEHERALQINPWLAQAHINLISLYGGMGQNEKAEKHYRAVVAFNPDLVDSHFNFGVLLIRQERYKEAIEAFHRCLQLDPYYADAHYNFAALIEQEGRLDEAAKHFRRAIENDPSHRLAHFHLGRILVHQEKFAEAIEQFLRTLSPEDEDTPRFMYALGATYIRSGERPKGVHYLREALKRASALRQRQMVESIERDLQSLEASSQPTAEKGSRKP